MITNCAAESVSRGETDPLSVQAALDKLFHNTKLAKAVKDVAEFNKEIDSYMNLLTLRSRYLTDDERKVVVKMLTKQQKLLSERISIYRNEEAK